MNKNRHLFSKIILIVFIAGIALSGCTPKEIPIKISSWVTSWDGINQLKEQPEIETTRKMLSDSIVISINPQRQHQPMLGFGGTFTDADVYNFMRMDKEERTKALKALFDPKEGAGWNLMRISFGSTDWDRDWNFYTYDDMPKGQKDDAQLTHFSVAEDVKRGHFELLREALIINPDLKIHASVWGPPAWMKDNDKLISDGTILPQYYGEYALYLVKSIQAYKKEGIQILAVSPQNEPLCTDGRVTPQALYLDWKSMRDMVRVIKETFVKNNIGTEIWIFDHNFIFTKSWVEPFITDSLAKGTFDGIAWHDYEGNEEQLCDLSAKFPDIPMYHTERALYTTYGLMRILRILRCGARSHNHWVSISDEYGAPYQFQGGSEKNDKRLEDKDLFSIYNLREKPDEWFKTMGYYTFAQLSHFVKRGAVRVDSDDSGSILANTAFQNPDGSIVLVVSNCGKQEVSFVVSLKGNQALMKLAPESAATYVIEKY